MKQTTSTKTADDVLGQIQSKLEITAKALERAETEYATEVGHLWTDRAVLREMLRNIAKHPDTPKLLRAYAAGELGAECRRALGKEPLQ